MKEKSGFETSPFVEALASVPGPPVETSTIDIIGVRPTSPRGIIKEKSGFETSPFVDALASVPGPPVETSTIDIIGVSPVSP